MKYFGFLSVFLLLCGCAGASYRPIVDRQGVDPQRYEFYLHECQQYALQTGDAASNAIVGAAAGAVIGSILGGVVGGDRSTAARMGMVEGGVIGGVNGETSQRNIIRRCMAGRGYQVLQ